MNDNFMLFATLYAITCLVVSLYFHKLLKPATFLAALVFSPIAVGIILLVGLYDLPKALIQAISIKQTLKQSYAIDGHFIQDSDVQGFYILSAEELRENDG